MHRARKRFGQHFLHDRNIIDRILRAIAPQAGDNILEIGFWNKGRLPSASSK
jgi:16S rRNA (adenine1518-N6/adenine1519-N6)-dimethyltransferase